MIAAGLAARNANALTETEKVEGPLDLVFIDAWKNDYIKYLKMILPKVRKGGIIIAHNIYNEATGEHASGWVTKAVMTLLVLAALYLTWQNARVLLAGGL